MNKIDTKLIGKNLIILEEVNSTQKYIKEKAKQGADNGLVVLANNQTEGCGTNGRIWYTKKNDNLTFSMLLKPNCDVKNIENLSIEVAKIIVHVIDKMYGYKLDIKYPNDVILNGKKIGGILTETLINKEIVKQIVIGVGLNINQEEFVDEIKDIATSLKKEFGRHFDKFEILNEFLKEFEKMYLKIVI